MAVNPVDAMTWKARELKISYGILLTQITEEERQEILEEYEEMLQKKEAEHQERLRQKAHLQKDFAVCSHVGAQIFEVVGLKHCFRSFQ